MDDAIGAIVGLGMVAGAIVMVTFTDPKALWILTGASIIAAVLAGVGLVLWRFA